MFDLYKSNNPKETLMYDTTFFFNWDSLQARLNNHYETWSYQKKRCIKRLNLFEKNLQLKHVCNLDLKPFRLQVKGKHSKGREFQSLAESKQTPSIEIYKS